MDASKQTGKGVRGLIANRFGNISNFTVCRAQLLLGAFHAFS